MDHEAVRLLKMLVAIESTNPDLVPDGKGEGPIADVVADRLEGLAVPIPARSGSPAPWLPAKPAHAPIPTRRPARELPPRTHAR